jgi:16S rRNA pseudouridine516 synthase
MLNKPKNMVTASKDKYSSCVLDLFQQESVKNLFAVGRLDKDTEGLLLLTNDGVFSHKITSPSHNLWKTYYAILNDYIDSSAITAFEHGISIGDLKTTKPSKLTILESSKNQSFVTLSISEGRYHQVKRMFQTLGLKVTYLKRISIGSLQLDDSLPLGAYRELTKSEIDAIFI